MPQIGDIAKAQEIGYKGTSRLIFMACELCGKERWVQLVKGDKPKSKRCFCINRSQKRKKENSLILSGHKSPQWKGGRKQGGRGYIDIYVQKDNFFFPMARKQKRLNGRVGYIPEHRLVMAQHLNRCLLPWEIVHHKNGIKDDNRIENLALLPSGYKHDALTMMGNYVRKLEKKVQYLTRALEMAMKKEEKDA